MIDWEKIDWEGPDDEVLIDGFFGSATRGQLRVRYEQHKQQRAEANFRYQLAPAFGATPACSKCGCPRDGNGGEPHRAYFCSTPNEYAGDHEIMRIQCQCSFWYLERPLDAERG